MRGWRVRLARRGSIYVELQGGCILEVIIVVRIVGRRFTIALIDRGVLRHADDKENQRKAAKTMGKSANDVTSELARGLAYAL